MMIFVIIQGLFRFDKKIIYLIVRNDCFCKISSLVQHIVFNHLYLVWHNNKDGILIRKVIRDMTLHLSQRGVRDRCDRCVFNVSVDQVETFELGQKL